MSTKKKPERDLTGTSASRFYAGQEVKVRHQGRYGVALRAATVLWVGTRNRSVRVRFKDETTTEVDMGEVFPLPRN